MKPQMNASHQPMIKNRMNQMMLLQQLAALAMLVSEGWTDFSNAGLAVGAVPCSLTDAALKMQPHSLIDDP